MGSLDRDAKELRDLAVHLKEERSCEEVAVMGHSTGCQDTVRLVQRHGKDEALPKLTGVILQAAVRLFRSLHDKNIEMSRRQVIRSITKHCPRRRNILQWH